MRRTAAAVALLLLLGSRGSAADANDLSGTEIYAGTCATCHGLDGRGAPEGTPIAVPLPDFTDDGLWW